MNACVCDVDVNVDIVLQTLCCSHKHAVDYSKDMNVMQVEPQIKYCEHLTLKGSFCHHLCGSNLYDFLS